MAEKSPEHDPYGRELEMQRQREEWVAEKKRIAEEQERAQKRGALESYLRRRTVEWEATAGEPPSTEELRSWQRQYLDEQESRHQAEREKKLREVELEHYNY